MREHQKAGQNKKYSKVNCLYYHHFLATPFILCSIYICCYIFSLFFSSSSSALTWPTQTLSIHAIQRIHFKLFILFILLLFFSNIK